MNKEDLYEIDGTTDDVLIYNCIIVCMKHIREELFEGTEDIELLEEEVEKMIHLLKALKINCLGLNKAIGSDKE